MKNTDQDLFRFRFKQHLFDIDEKYEKYGMDSYLKSCSICVEDLREHLDGF